MNKLNEDEARWMMSIEHFAHASESSHEKKKYLFFASYVTQQIYHEANKRLMTFWVMVNECGKKFMRR